MPPLREVPDDADDDTPLAGPGEPTDPRAADDPHGVDLWVMPYIEDTALRPVLIVVIAHVVAFIAPILLLAFRDRSPGPMVTAAALVLLTARGFRFEHKARGRFGAISFILVVTWIASGIAAYYGDRYDFL